MRIWPPLCSSQYLSERIKLSAKYLQNSWENKCFLLNFWEWKVGKIWDLKRRKARSINRRQITPGNEMSGWHHNASFTCSRSQPGNDVDFMLCFLLCHNQTAVTPGRSSFHLILSEVITHHHETLRMGKPVLLPQPKKELFVGRMLKERMKRQKRR